MKTIEEAIEFFKPILNKFKKCETVWIGGGCLREYLTEGTLNKDTDIDIFFKSTKYLEETKKEFNKKYEKIKESVYADQYLVDNNKIHIVTYKTFDTIEDAVGDMDFTICSGMLSNSFDFHCNDTYQNDLENKILKLNNTNPEKDFLFLRVLKYIEKGYTLSQEEKEKINEILITSTKTGIKKKYIKETTWNWSRIDQQRLEEPISIPEDNHFNSISLLEQLRRMQFTSTRGSTNTSLMF